MNLLNSYYEGILESKINYENLRSKTNKNEKYILSSFVKHLPLVRLELLNKTFLEIIMGNSYKIFELNSIHFYCISHYYIYFKKLKERYIFIPANSFDNVFNAIVEKDVMKYIVIFNKNSVMMLENERLCIIIYYLYVV